MTGQRLVSLPFSDHCEILADSEADQEELLAHVCEHVVRDRYAYAEIRASAFGEAAQRTPLNLRVSETFYLHKLSLVAPFSVLFSNLHRSCIQRKIRRAETVGLAYMSGRSESFLRKFYNLLLRTRRRQCLPPQPLSWFRNLIETMGDNLTIRIASNGPCPVAAMLTLSHKATITYKYGCSDERFNNLGGTPFLLWKTIQEAKNQGMRELDLGRSELNNRGLVDFKDRLGAVKTVLAYQRYPSAMIATAERRAWQIQVAKGIISWIPDGVFVASGKLLYRHIG